jgi:hypothetical protein
MSRRRFLGGFSGWHASQPQQACILAGRPRSRHAHSHTLLNNDEPCGSASTTWMAGLASFRTLDTPAIVPPVPAPATNACSRPPVCCRISRP